MTFDLLILEDDADRVRRFRTAASRLGLTPRVWLSAVEMIAEAGPWLPEARLLSLDHDLEPSRRGLDPGDGLDVAKWLGERSPVCPVVVHTSNNRRGDAMEGELALAGWAHGRVLPIGDEWIEVDWYALARKFLREARKDRRE